MKPDKAWGEILTYVNAASECIELLRQLKASQDWLLRLHELVDGYITEQEGLDQLIANNRRLIWEIER